jgi:archaellum component FlaC
MFQETDKKFQDVAERFRETDKKFDRLEKTVAEVSAQIKETNRTVSAQIRETNQTISAQIKETNQTVAAQIEETNRTVTAQIRETNQAVSAQIRETNQTVSAQIKETDQAVAELSVQIKETDRLLAKSKQELDRKMGELGNRFGELAEHLVAPSINEKFNLLGYHFDDVSPGGLCIDDLKGNMLAEIDILLQNKESMVAVEVKSKPLERHIDEHIKRLEVLRAWADRHGDHRKIYGAAAGAIFSAGIRRYALNAGFYVIVQTEDTVKINIPQGFQPRRW